MMNDVYVNAGGGSLILPGGKELATGSGAAFSESDLTNAAVAAWVKSGALVPADRYEAPATAADLASMTAERNALAAELDAAKGAIDRLTEEVDRLTAELEAATAPKGGEGKK